MKTEILLQRIIYITRDKKPLDNKRVWVNDR